MVEWCHTAFQLSVERIKNIVNSKTEMKIDSASETGIAKNGTKATKRIESNAEAFVRMANELVARSSDDAVEGECNAWEA